MKQDHLYILFAILLAVIFICICSSRKDDRRDGYMRSNLGQQNIAYRVPPVDYVFKSEDSPIKPADQPAWYYGDPHLITEPKNKYKPLEYGGVDFWAETRKLDDGTLFEQYGNNYKGSGLQMIDVPNNDKTRALLTELGSVGIARQLDNDWNARFEGTPTTYVGLRAKQYLKSIRDPYPQYEDIYTGIPHVIGS